MDFLFELGDQNVETKKGQRNHQKYHIQFVYSDRLTVFFLTKGGGVLGIGMKR